MRPLHWTVTSCRCSWFRSVPWATTWVRVQGVPGASGLSPVAARTRAGQMRVTGFVSTSPRAGGASALGAAFVLAVAVGTIGTIGVAIDAAAAGPVLLLGLRTVNSAAPAAAAATTIPIMRATTGPARTVVRWLGVSSQGEGATRPGGGGMYGGGACGAYGDGDCPARGDGSG